MTAIYTFDIVSTLDGFGSFEGGDWGGFWGKQGPELSELDPLNARMASMPTTVVSTTLNAPLEWANATA